MSGSVDVSISCGTNGGCEVSVGVSASFAEDETDIGDVDYGHDEFHGESAEHAVVYYKIADPDLN